MNHKLTQEELTVTRQKNADYFKWLQEALDHDRMSPDEVQKQKNMKRQEIIKEHEKHRKIALGSDGRWRTRLPDGKMVAKTDRKDLDDAIVKFYSQQEESKRTLRNLYPEAMAFKRKHGKAEGTLARYRNDWDKYLKDSPELVDKDIAKLTTGYCYEWTVNFLNKYPMKRKCYMNVQSLINEIYSYAMIKDYITDNPFKRMKKDFDLLYVYDGEEDEEERFTAEEAKAVTKYLWARYNADQSYTAPLAILFVFATGVRVGELNALKFSDITEKDGAFVLKITRQLVKAYDEQGNSKGYEFKERAKSLNRKKPVVLSEDALAIINLARKSNELNGDVSDDLIFHNKHRHMTTATINRLMITSCEKTGIPVRRIHKVRKTFASILFDAGVNTKMIADLLGDNLGTVERHYIKNAHSSAEVAAIINAVQKNVTPCNTIPDKEKTPISL